VRRGSLDARRLVLGSSVPGSRSLGLELGIQRKSRTQVWGAGSEQAGVAIALGLGSVLLNLTVLRPFNGDHSAFLERAGDLAEVRPRRSSLATGYRVHRREHRGRSPAAVGQALPANAVGRCRRMPPLCRQAQDPRPDGSGNQGRGKGPAWSRSILTS